METVSVQFTIQYTSNLSPAETHPHLHAYLDSTIQNDPVKIELKEGVAQPVKLTGTYDSKRPLPQYVKIVFYATANRLNDHGCRCRIDAGFGMLNLVDILNSPGTFSKDVPLKLYSCDGYVKGVLRVSSRPELLTLGPRIQWASARIAAKTGDAARTLLDSLAQMRLDENDEPLPVEKEMLETINKTMKTEMSFPNTDPETANVRVPIYYGDVGMTRKVPLPAAAFMMFQTPKSNLAFWKNVVEVCLRRDGRTVHDVMRLPLNERARLMADICCAVPQALDYIGDVIDKNRPQMRKTLNVKYDPSKVAGCERFGDALRDKCGDCEDLALAILMVFTALLEAGDAGMFKGVAYLEELHRIARQYVPFVTLDSVTSAAVKYDAPKGKRKLGAHLALKFFPGPYAEECIARSPDSDSKRRMRFPKWDADAWALAVLIAEGTGMLESLGRIGDDIAGERRSVFSMVPALDAFKKKILRAPGARSPFYLSCMVALTNFFVRLPEPIPVLGFWMGYYGKGSDPTVGPPNKFQRGASFIDIENKSDKVVVYPQPAFSEAVMEWMRVAVRIRVPPRDLVITDKCARKYPEHNATLDVIVERVRKLERVVTVKQRPVSVYVRPRQLVDIVVHRLLQDIERSRIVTQVSYQAEHLTDWLCSYRVGFHANAQ